LLNNGDVENGLSPWVARGAAQVQLNSTTKRSGNNSIYVSNRTSAWHGAAYPLPLLTPGNTYEFYAWVRLPAGDAATNAKLTIQYTDAAGAKYPNVASANVNSNGWTLLSGSYLHSPSGSVSDLLVYIEADSTTANFYVDDLAMTGRIDPPPIPPTGADITVNTGTTYQVIDGFGGAMPMWGQSSWTAAETRTLVGMGDEELGMSIVRTIIDPERDQWGVYADALALAQSYGDKVQILGSPWTPPAAWKTNNSRVNGGKLKPEFYDDYALHLNDYVQYMRGRGVTIDVTSIQNEPDWHPEYDSCDWSGDEFRIFLRDHGDKIQNTSVMIGEGLGFARNLTDPSLNDSVAVTKFGHIGGHIYGQENGPNLSAYPLATQKGKKVWMTEWNFHQADGTDGGTNGSTIWRDPQNKAVWDETLDTILRTVHRSMEANWGAYIWWWARRYYSFIGDETNGRWPTPKGEVLKRGWAFSHYSKYIRPGYVRVGVSKTTKTNGLEVTAYQGDNKIVLVILNRQTGSVNGTVVGIPHAIDLAEFYYTSQYSARESRAITIDGQKATFDVGPRSVSTVVLSY
jgi:O-glycosyl hydrolase